MLIRWIWTLFNLISFNRSINYQKKKVVILLVIKYRFLILAKFELTMNIWIKMIMYLELLEHWLSLPKFQKSKGSFQDPENWILRPAFVVMTPKYLGRIRPDSWSRGRRQEVTGWTGRTSFQTVEPSKPISGSTCLDRLKFAKLLRLHSVMEDIKIR